LRPTRPMTANFFGNRAAASNTASFRSPSKEGGISTARLTSAIAIACITSATKKDAAGAWPLNAASHGRSDVSGNHICTCESTTSAPRIFFLFTPRRPCPSAYRLLEGGGLLLLHAYPNGTPLGKLRNFPVGVSEIVEQIARILPKPRRITPHNTAARP